MNKEQQKEQLREEAYIQLKDRPFQLIGIDRFYGEQTSINSMVDFAYTQLQQKEAELTESFIKTRNNLIDKFDNSREKNKQLQAELELKNSMLSDFTQLERQYNKGIRDLKAELTEAKKEVERLRELLVECGLQFEYLNDKFNETGTTNQLLSKIKSLTQDKTE